MYNKQHYQKTRKSQQVRKYGITGEDYKRMMEEQGGVCAICDNPPGTRDLHVDHDHNSGDIRALLCHHCNSALGLFREDISVMKKAIKYLEIHSPAAA